MSQLAHTNSEPSPLQALELRRWALRCLSSSLPAAGLDGQTALGEISPSTWNLFLAIERCAAPLVECRDGLIQALSPGVQELLKATATAELKRILTARSQLQALSDLARDVGCRPTLIRGGAFLTLAKRSYDLDDLDILLPPAEARALAAALDAAGYRPLGQSSYRHLSGRSAPGSLTVEIHVAGAGERGLPNVAALEDVMPVQGLPGLARLSPLEHAWSILGHVTVDHMYRRGRIRDLLLLAAAIAECGPDERLELDQRAHEHAAGGVMEAELGMARALNDGMPSADAFENVALANYVLLSRAPGTADLPGNLRSTASRWVFAILGGPAERRTAWADTMALTIEPSQFRFIAWVQRKQPKLGQIWVRLFRVLRLPFALALAAPMVLAIRRELRRAGLEPRFG